MQISLTRLCAFCCKVLCLIAALMSSAQAIAPEVWLVDEVAHWVAEQNKTSIEHVSVTPPDARVKVQPCSDKLTFDYPFANRESVRVRCTKPTWQLFVKVALVKPNNSVATTRALPAGHMLSEADLVLRPDLTPASGSFTERRPLIGRQLKRAMGKAQVIVSGDLDTTLQAARLKQAARADEVLSMEMIEWVTLPRSTVPPSVWLGSELPPGLRLARDVQGGQILQTSDLAESRQVVVATSNLSAGSILRAGTIKLDKFEQDKVTPTHLFALNGLEGFELMRAFKAGEAIRSTDLRPALMVKRGEVVLFSVGRPNEFQVSVKLEALQDGRLGEQIKLRNNESGRNLSGVVTGPGAVRGM